jgi:DNA-binding response OmpR family regulator
VTGFLDGLRILLVEDEYLLALDMQETMEGWGATVVGPVGRLEPAVALAQSEALDGAILDLTLYGEDALPLADLLLADGLPLIFLTGYTIGKIPDRFAGIPVLAKPFDGAAGEQALRKVFRRV